MEKPRFINVPINVIAHDWTNVSTACLAEGIPRPSIKWLKGGYPIDVTAIDEETDEPRCKIVTTDKDDKVSSELSITHFNPHDNGDVR